VRGLDILKLQLFVLHNTDTISFPLFSSRFLRYNKQNISYLNGPEPIAFLSLAVDASGRLYDDFIRLLFLQAQRDESALAHELPEESDQFRFLRVVCLTNLKGSVGLIMVKESATRISIPLDLSSRPFIPLPCFIRSHRPTAILTPSLVIFTP
jgi:hypothetical protein